LDCLFRGFSRESTQDEGKDSQEGASKICTRGLGVLQSAPDLRERGHGPIRGQEEPSSSDPKAEEAEKRFSRPFCRNSLRLYALSSGFYHALPDEKGKVHTRFETSGPGAFFQHDSSYHLWLPHRSRKQCLILTKDDYSRKVVGAKLVEAETSFEHLQMVRQTISSYGFPLVYYLDNHSIFQFVLHQGVHVRYKSRKDEGEIQFRRALSSLGVGMIYTGKKAGSGQGKGRKDI
jgi:hypothetical protein